MTDQISPPPAANQPVATDGAPEAMSPGGGACYSGVYSLWVPCVGKRYIGISRNVRARRADHFRRLRAGNHRNSYLQHAYVKYGEAALSWELLEKAPVEILEEREVFWIRFFRSNEREFGYNLDVGGGYLREVSAETRARISSRCCGRVASASTRIKLSRASRGRRLSEETKKRLSDIRTGVPRPSHVVARLVAAHKGIPLSPEHRAALSKALTGRRFSQAHRDRIAAANRLRRVSPETRAKIAKAMTGRRISEATRTRMSASHTGIPHPKVRGLT